MIKTFNIEIKHPQVIAFANAMDEVLTKNDHKEGWRNCASQYLQARLIEEVGEYFALIARGSPSASENKAKELVDIANFAMMLWDRESEWA